MYIMSKENKAYDDTNKNKVTKIPLGMYNFIPEYLHAHYLHAFIALTISIQCIDHKLFKKILVYILFTEQ